MSLFWILLPAAMALASPKAHGSLSPKKTILKCCPSNMVTPCPNDFDPEKSGCITRNHTRNFSDELVFDEHLENTEGEFLKYFQLEVVKDFEQRVRFQNGDRTFKSIAFRKKVQQIYFHADGSVNIHDGDKKFNARNDFCIEYASCKTKIVPVLWVLSAENLNFIQRFPLAALAGTILSACGLVLVLLVYAILPQLRTLGGKILMACVSSLLAFYIIWTTYQTLVMNNLQSEELCKSCTFLIYFAFLTSIFWMNVMSLDVWWTFSGTTKNHRSPNSQFLLYCAYAYGVPALLTVAAAVVNEIDLKSPINWMITPKVQGHSCMLKGAALWYYLYTPVLILLTANCVFFTMTGLSVLRLQRGAAVLDRTKKKTDRRNQMQFMVYLKLSLVMGINWLFEIIGSLNPSSLFTYIHDVYNIMTGSLIFIIFVCKPIIWRRLKKRFCKTTSKENRRSSKAQFIRSSSGSGSDTELSTDDSGLQQTICLHPKGKEVFGKLVIS